METTLSHLGLSVSNKAELLVSQDFFADLLLPYSVKRGEVFPLNISVFNTVNQKLPMKVTLKTSEDYTAESPGNVLDDLSIFTCT